ncbi:hypothetical protein QMK33_12955 [Hymenobacter sp. H14-R3]|uniref:DUF6985 domain-containing protein n=1 Tax=Hymenobacter sp. H14-R3 TaxID=3046308 RepID=UPI0024BACEEC|nr:hypothetical protein [Hymenobacter sp. H14-R3]MDJ0366066.1 hypothetical protein [Hymenobacter sp. H14-R3]
MSALSLATAGSTAIPTLEWAEYKWLGTIALHNWEAFNQGRGTWKAVRAATNARRRKREKHAGQERDSYGPNDDPLELDVDSPVVNVQLPPRPEQVRAYEWLLAHESELLQATLAYFYRHWWTILLTYSYDDDDNANRHSLPAKLRAPEELRGLIELHRVYIKGEHTDGVAHIGLALSCDWDTEHGMGVYTCRSEVLGFGSSDLAAGDLDDAFELDEEGDE